MAQINDQLTVCWSTCFPMAKCHELTPMRAYDRGPRHGAIPPYMRVRVYFWICFWAWGSFFADSTLGHTLCQRQAQIGHKLVLHLG